MIFSFKPSNLLKQQIKEVELWHKSFTSDDFSVSMDFPKLVSMQHKVNFELWHQEDVARDPEATDSEIAIVKRKIDTLNQKRNDLIEHMDQFLVKVLKNMSISNYQKLEMNSETPGNIFDRLSINALKIYHMDEETKRKGADKNHREKCLQKLLILREQREDLSMCLYKLLDDLYVGRKFLKVYHQMKMYNDENLNPVLYSKKHKRD